MLFRSILTADGDKQGTVLRAEGDKQSAILRAEGQAQAIGTVFQSIHDNDPDPKLLAYQYLQTLPQLASAPGNTVWMIPSELTTALKAVTSAFNGDESAASGLAQAFRPGRQDEPAVSKDLAPAADLAATGLPAADVTAAELAGADLAVADLAVPDLAEEDLAAADLTGADLAEVPAQRDEPAALATDAS